MVNEAKAGKILADKKLADANGKVNTYAIYIYIYSIHFVYMFLKRAQPELIYIQVGTPPCMYIYPLVYV